MKLVLMSDTHNRHKDVTVPDGDCVIHSGDFTVKGYLPEVRDFLEWYSKLPHKHKILISGNHERVFGEAPELAHSVLSEYPSVTYLEDQGAELDGVMFWGSPWRAVDHFSSWVFSDFDENLGKKWGLIPDNVDVLITHGPPFGIGDVIDYSEVPTEHLGSTTLYYGVKKLKPKLHVFGHIHQGYGVHHGMYGNDTVSINAATCDGHYQPVNSPIEWKI